LTNLSQQQGIDILFAVEAGSRAWGLASPASDYDVRFVYRRSLDYYLSIYPGHDDTVTSQVDGVDMHGWDVKKASGLLGASNPSLYEWVLSGVVYQPHWLMDTIQENIDTLFSSKTLAYHYGHLAKDHHRRYIENEPVQYVKKLLHFARAVLAVTWIRRTGELPPINISLLRAVVDDTAAGEQLDRLVELKRHEEVDVVPSVELVPLARWLTNQYRQWEANHGDYGTVTDKRRELINSMFRKVVND
jgi:predicted nucleotidyltransferase